MSVNDDIPFNRDFPLKPGVVDRPVPGVRRVVCDNPGPFTFTGTVSYIVGEGRVAIVDPGPDDATHIAALLDAVRGETVTHIFVTHTHRDHSPAVPLIKKATGATVYAEGPHRPARPMHADEPPRHESNDLDFRPDVRLTDGEVVEGEGWALQAVATPGHTANHMAFSWVERSLTFVGDHVMGWSTTIVVPPDGAMIDYMASLEKLAARPEQLYFPGHGPEIPEGPRFTQFMIRHRRAREASILHRLAKGEADIPSIVRASYIGIDPRLMNAAGYSVLAHLEDMVERGIVATDGAPTIDKTYRLLAPLG
ncbi:MBL fold metallo-hydrolase [[Pseudomonas] carboxydohydrogena]|uniref:MBL fold metallo-hydrolase n=1 Tax=Afipia carboxydohydrogena TaxID=290 RepID=A0ABY8BP51_AFICR|nr:MBL fold metallo-hydrolase [[Pseudomonas] carboxydohydrogena]WEF50766.1 MBL fold metallo-hydrolase [[Pseudomonas] carboxydohydrogena]